MDVQQSSVQARDTSCHSVCEPYLSMQHTSQHANSLGSNKKHSAIMVAFSKLTTAQEHIPCSTAQSLPLWRIIIERCSVTLSSLVPVGCRHPRDTAAAPGSCQNVCAVAIGVEEDTVPLCGQARWDGANVWTMLARWLLLWSTLTWTCIARFEFQA